MGDIFDKLTRSDIMRKIKSRNNLTTELRLIKLFKENGITGWRRYYSVIGHPDFVFQEKRAAIFVDGCFWHGHDCRYIYPKNNEDYWQRKRARNMQHDNSITLHFENRGWTVLRIWECELKKKNLNITLDRIRKLLNH